MPVPLHVDDSNLARLAVDRAPRLAGILAAAHHTGTPLSVTSHLVGAPEGLGVLLISSDPLAEWLRGAAQVPSAAPTPAPAVVESRRSSVFAPVADVYRRLEIDRGSVLRPMGADELLEAARPSEPGQTASVVNATASLPASRSDELLELTAEIVRHSFGDDVDRVATGGSFDTTVFSNLAGAADVIAPGKRPSELTERELQAVVTAAVHSSNGAFLQQLHAKRDLPPAVMQAARTLPDGATVAKQFMQGGRFDEQAFAAKTQSGALNLARLSDASPAGLKLGLLAVATEKAKVLVQELPKARTRVGSLLDQVRRSVGQRLDELEMVDRPTERHTAPERPI